MSTGQRRKFKRTLYVSLSHIHRSGRLIPGAGVYDLANEGMDDWRQLIGSNTLTLWRVEDCPTLAEAKDRVLAYLAGHAPYTVTRMWDRDTGYGRAAEPAIALEEEQL